MNRHAKENKKIEAEYEVSVSTIALVCVQGRCAKALDMQTGTICAGCGSPMKAMTFDGIRSPNE